MQYYVTLPSLVLPDYRGPAPDGDQREHHLPAGPRLRLSGGGHQPPQHLLHQTRGGVPHISIHIYTYIYTYLYIYLSIYL